MQLRALVGARVSVVKGPQKVSHEAQHEHGSKWAAQQGHVVVATFEDLDVSADKFTPWQRPDLGKYLTDEASYEWDILVFSKVDRAFRSMQDCFELAKWLKDRKKILVFSEDGLTLNYRDDTNEVERMMAELFVVIASFFAQIELNRFKTRALNAHQVLRGTNRWAYGTPPLGYRTVDHPSGKGRGLEPDDYGKDLLHQMAGKLFDGWSFNGIAKWLNEEGFPTNSDRFREEPRKDPWTATNVKRVLTSLSTQGYKVDKHRKPMLDTEGNYIVYAEPTFEWSVWEQIQQEVTARSFSGKRRQYTDNPMSKVGFCLSCGSTLTQSFVRHKKTKEISGRYYRCSRSPKICPGVSVRADVADSLVEQTFLNHLGDEQVVERVFRPGQDNTRELAQVKETIARLRRESDAGLIVGPDDEAEYQQRLKALIARRSTLEAQPHVPAGWNYVETGETYTEAFMKADSMAKRKMIVDSAVRLYLAPKGSAADEDIFAGDIQPRKEGPTIVLHGDTVTWLEVVTS